MLDSQTTPRPLKGMYIGGQWVKPDRSFDDMNPNDGSIWARAPEGGRAEARAAIAAAHAAFPAWSELKFSERAHIEQDRRRLGKARARLRRRHSGRRWRLVRQGHVRGRHYVPEVFRAAAAVFTAIGEVMPSEHGKFSTAVRFPMGVISVISPWNFPGILSRAASPFRWPPATRSC
jgi:vanillin dehydrogenase